MKKILLIGGGGHCKSVLDAIFEQQFYTPVGILDLKENVGQNVLGVPVSGTDSELESYFKKGVKLCFITAGSVGNPTLRIRLAEKAISAGFRFPNIIHPDAVVSKHAILGRGNFIAAGAIINAGTALGNFCIINTGSAIDHDCKVGNFVHIAAGAALSGNVTIGNYSHVGTGASIVHSTEIGFKTIIGAGSAVVKNIANGVVCFGNPARVMRDNES